MAWLEGWNYRKSITLSNSGSELTDYQLKFTVYRTGGVDSGYNVYVGTKCKSDYSDIRFASTDGATYNYWIESSNSSSAAIWVKVPLIPAGNTTLYLYYGNPNATAISNGDNTFLFFDDFPGTALDTSKWTVVASNGISVADGLYRVSADSGSSTYGTIRSNVSVGPNIALRIRLQTRTYNTNAGFGAADYSGTGSSIGWVYYKDYESAVYTGAAFRNHWIPPRTEGSSQTDGDIITDPPSGFFTDEFAVPASAPLQWRRNDGAWTSSTRYNGISSAQPLEINHLRYYGPMACDWVIIRKYSTTEPTVSSWGGEELPLNITDLIGYSRYKRITFGLSSGTLNSYQYKITINRTTGADSGPTCYVGSFCSSDYKDIIFVADDLQYRLAHWVESYDDNSATVWVCVPTLVDGTTIRMYYNKADATSFSSGAETFIMFDHFDGNSLDTTLWASNNSPDLTFSNSEMTLSSSSTANRGITSLTTFPTNTAIRIRMKRTGTSSHAEYFGYDTTYLLDGTNEAYYKDDDGTSYLYTKSGGTGSLSSSLGASDTNYHVWDLIRNATSSVILVRDGSTLVTKTTDVPTTALNTLYVAYNGSIVVDWFALRNYSETEPTISSWTTNYSTILTAEQYGRYIKLTWTPIEQ